MLILKLTFYSLSYVTNKKIAAKLLKLKKCPIKAHCLARCL